MMHARQPKQTNQKKEKKEKKRKINKGDNNIERSKKTVPEPMSRCVRRTTSQSTPPQSTNEAC